ncbi:MAG: hypothetical protein EP347_00780 [Alphaproteobacteria bacterium]|nr:MAG: hypothetical protein EP347_00780 [Alphaproteobacteria bacterium]
MRAIFGILGSLAFAFLMVIYLFRGFGPDETGALFRDADRLPTRYFSTPESAVRRINTILATLDWRELAQYYELEGSDISKKQLLDGSFFLNDPDRLSDPRNFLHPFPPGARFYGSRQLDGSDIFEVDVLWEMDAPWAKGQKHLTTFHLTRSPEGYRLLPDRVVTQPLQKSDPVVESDPQD